MNSYFSRQLNRLWNFLQRYSQVLLVVLVLMLGTTGVVFGATSIKRSISAPFALKSGTSLGDAALTESSLAAQQHKDTDGDELSDYDELYVYRTSPYLPDSDSDGVPDGQEVKNGTDPNCPEGKTCVVESAPAPASAAPAFPVVPPATTPQTLSATELRATLKQIGLDSATVDALSDEQILQAYQEALQGSQPQNQTSSSANTNSNGSPVPQNLTAAQVRELLIKNGVPSDKLKGVLDADVLKIYQQTVAELSNQPSH